MKAAGSSRAALASGVKAKPNRCAGEDLVPGRRDEHARQVLLFVLATVDREVPVIEVEAPHCLGQAHRELVADGAHPQTRTAAADSAGEVDPDQGGVVDGRGRGEGQAQPLVDRRADGAGLGADTGRREQNMVGAVLGAVAVAQRPRAGGQFAVQEPAQRGLGVAQPIDQGHNGSPPFIGRHQGARCHGSDGRERD